MAESDAHSAAGEERYGSVFGAAGQGLSLKEWMPNTVRIDPPLLVPVSAEGEETPNPVCARDEAPSPRAPSPSLRRREPETWETDPCCDPKEPAVQLWKVDEQERAALRKHRLERI